MAYACVDWKAARLATVSLAPFASAVEQRDVENNESPTLAMKSTDLASLTSEGATVLLGVLLADMTGTSLSLYGVAGIASSCYYPAAFVNDVRR